MRLRISLFELLLLVTPAFAIVLGLLVAAVRSSELYVLTIAQSVYLVALLGTVCALFQRQPGVRVFGGAFLAASLGHFLLVHLASQSNYGGAFPTTLALTKIWEQANPGQTAAYADPYLQFGASTWTGSLPGGGYSGGMYPGGPNFGGFPVFTTSVAVQRPQFVDVGVWAISLLLGVLCGVVARSLRGNEPEASKTAAA
jgi:hypothetical protein